MVEVKEVLRLWLKGMPKEGHRRSAGPGSEDGTTPDTSC
jgi:hypothetical protein